MALLKEIVLRSDCSNKRRYVFSFEWDLLRGLIYWTDLAGLPRSGL